MKTNLGRGGFGRAAAWVLAAATLVAAGRAAEPEERVGVYDSRVVAYAHFWSAEVRAERERAVAAAKAESDPEKRKAAAAALEAEQRRSHLQVFGTEPAVEAMAALRDRLPSLRRELGVGRFVSRWDEAALREVPEARRVDVTDRLAAEFHPDEQRRKTIESLKKTEPIPRWRMRLMLWFGRVRG